MDSYSIKLAELNDHLLKKYDSWRILEETYEDEDRTITPADKNSFGEISNKNGEVWCLSSATFSNGEVHTGCSMCRADSNEGPLLWSVTNHSKDVYLFVPPTPDFVLEIEGPINFCKEFGKQLHEVFPIKFKVIPRFETEPKVRSILIYEDGTIVVNNSLN